MLRIFAVFFVCQLFLIGGDSRSSAERPFFRTDREAVRLAEAFKAILQSQSIHVCEILNRNQKPPTVFVDTPIGAELLYALLGDQDAINKRRNSLLVDAVRVLCKLRLVQR